jgi:urease accessory protein
MRRATTHFKAGHWPVVAAVDAVTLDFDARHRRRFRLNSDGGDAVLLDLPKAVAMADGDGLRLDDGSWIAVRAAVEELAEITCDDQMHLVRVAWHLGNRHLPTQIDGMRLLIRPDHVIEDMARGLGAVVRHVRAPFQPEGGAYGEHSHPHADDHHGHHHHGGGHGHTHGHGHAH